VAATVSLATWTIERHYYCRPEPTPWIKSGQRHWTLDTAANTAGVDKDRSRVDSLSAGPLLREYKFFYALLSFPLMLRVKLDL